MRIWALEGVALLHMVCLLAFLPLSPDLGKCCCTIFMDLWMPRHNKKFACLLYSWSCAYVKTSCIYLECYMLFSLLFAFLLLLKVGISLCFLLHNEFSYIVLFLSCKFWSGYCPVPDYRSSSGGGSVILDDCNFHESVQLDSFDIDRTLHLVRTATDMIFLFPYDICAAKLHISKFDNYIYHWVDTTRWRIFGDELPDDSRI